MRKMPMTFTMPENVIRDLHLYTPKREMSSFVARCVELGLQEKKQQLARDFEEAAQDEERNKEIAEWDVCTGDGLDETNEYNPR